MNVSILFNVVFDAVICHWVYMEAEEEEEEVPKGFGWDIQRLGANFYANDGLIASTRAAGIQREFNVLTDIFDQVSLHTNVGKNVNIS